MCFGNIPVPGFEKSDQCFGWITLVHILEIKVCALSLHIMNKRISKDPNCPLRFTEAAQNTNNQKHKISKLLLKQEEKTTWTILQTCILPLMHLNVIRHVKLCPPNYRCKLIFHLWMGEREGEKKKKSSCKVLRKNQHSTLIETRPEDCIKKMKLLS